MDTAFRQTPKKIPVISFRSITGILSVGIISAGNFLASYLMINFSTETDYGLYVSILSGLMLASGIQNAVVCTPMSIGAAKMEVRQRNEFVSSILAFQLAFLFVTILATFVFDLLFNAFDFENSPPIALSLLSLLTATFLLREFLRIRGYLYGEATAILAGDFFHFLANGTFLIILSRFNLNIEAVAATLCTSNCLYLFFEAKRSKIHTSTDKKSAIKALSDAWQRGGKWSLPGVLATWAQNNAFVYLSAMLISIEATAMLAATRLLLMPVNIISSGLNVVYRPSWAKRIVVERSVVGRSTRRICISLCFLLTIYIVVLALTWEYIVMYVFGGKFNDGFKLLLLWGVVFFLQNIRSRESNMLQLLEDFKYLTIVGAPAAVLCLFVSMVAILNVGTSGALYGIIVSELVMITLFHRRWARD